MSPNDQLQQQYEQQRSSVTTKQYYDLYDLVHSALAQNVRAGEQKIPQYYSEQWLALLADPQGKKAFETHFSANGRELTFGTKGLQFGVKPKAVISPPPYTPWIPRTAG